MEINKEKAICRCKNVFYHDIEKAVKNGASTFEEVQEVTNISTGCGRCEKEAREIVEHIIKTKANQ
ncbi:(2Fe-2S)-binding protein [Lachnoclostridium phytofermentans]|uniref:(2Fe-2S)-binding protein n=1 Tax=Lachnoclostridium phytofermentans TaxID=66219 RepID=UPI000A3DAF92|nr:(2Fe-2S)-binding protein [Lachnoclostridium phytofermentans]